MKSNATLRWGYDTIPSGGAGEGPIINKVTAVEGTGAPFVFDGPEQVQPVRFPTLHCNKPDKKKYLFIRVQRTGFSSEFSRYLQGDLNKVAKKNEAQY